MDISPDHELLTDLRKELHKFPELSGNEIKTSERISGFLKELKPDELITGLGGYGIAARFRGKEPGRRIMVRAELDALPIYESNELGYKSLNPGVSHKCGHDGHMAVAAGVARLFSGNRPEQGELVVLFQPAEEIGRGAHSVINDRRFSAIEPDYVLAMHNLPGYGLNEIILRKEAFAAASEGMIVNLKGRTSHAGEPENGISPAAAMSHILNKLPELPRDSKFKNYTLATVIHARLGEIAFGTSPGEAVIMATLRAFDENEMELLKTGAVGLVHDIARKEKLGVSVDWTEKFPLTANDPFIVSLAGEIASRLGYRTVNLESAFRWSEDFGWFTRKYRGMLFGIGAGIDHPDLHNPDYDFPDEIISTGVRLIGEICRELLNTD